MTTPHPTPPDWGPCPPGTLSGLTAALKRRRRERLAWRAAAVASVLLAAATAGWYGPRAVVPDAEVQIHGGLTCREVRQRLPDYLHGRVAGGLVHQIEQHLAECPPCRDVWQRMQADALPQGAARRGAVCPRCGGEHGGSSWTRMETLVATLLAQ